jgi:sigma-B regulation protein RsbU (phosphoserine phosphatase)
MMRFRIEIPDDRSHLGTLLTAIDCALIDDEVDTEVRNDLLLITEELACNALDHGRVGRATDPSATHNHISVEIIRHGDALHVEFRDAGKPFNPLVQLPPDLDCHILDRPVGGLGVHLIRELAESVSYSREGPHNILRVILRSPPPPEESTP